MSPLKSLTGIGNGNKRLVQCHVNMQVGRTDQPSSLFSCVILNMLRFQIRGQHFLLVRNHYVHVSTAGHKDMHFTFKKL